MARTRSRGRNRPDGRRGESGGRWLEWECCQHERASFGSLAGSAPTSAGPFEPVFQREARDTRQYTVWACGVVIGVVLGGDGCPLNKLVSRRFATFAFGLRRSGAACTPRTSVAHPAAGERGVGLGKGDPPRPSLRLTALVELGLRAIRCTIYTKYTLATRTCSVLGLTSG